MGSKPKSPPPPDTVGAAKAEAAGNKEVAQITAGYNRPTQIDPYGQTTWTFKGQGGTVDPALQQRVADAERAYNATLAMRAQPRDGISTASVQQQQAAALASLNAARAAATTGMGSPDNPRPGDWVQTTTLTPAQQAILEAEQGNDLRLQQLASQGIDVASGVLGKPFDPQGLPVLQGARGIGQSGVGIPGATLADMSRISEDPNQFAAQRKDVSDALYRELTRYSGERFGREEAAERNRLSNMGFTQGTEAYDNALREFMRSKDESYASAADRAVLAGGAEQSRLLSDLLAARGSNIGLGEAQFGQGVNRYQLDLGERQAQQQSDLALAALQGQNRQQMFQEEAFKRGLPLNEIAQLMSGASPQLPQFQPFSQMQPWQGPQLLDAELGQYNARLGATNAQNAARGQDMSTLGTLAMAGATYFA